MVKASPLLSNKPVIYAANLSESDFTGDIEKNEQYRAVCEIAKAENSVVLPICAQIEAEIADMSAEDKEMFLSELGLKESGLNRIIKAGLQPAWSYILSYRRRSGGPCMDYNKRH